MDFASVALGFFLGWLYCTQCWQFRFLSESIRLLLAAGCSVSAALRGEGSANSLDYVQRSSQRVWPLDLDFSTGHLHQNNVCYFVDVQGERLKFLFRGGFGPALGRAPGVRMVLTDQQVRFRRELLPGQPYEILTKWCGWSDDAVFLEQSFVTDGGRMVNCIMYLKLKLKFKKDGTGIQSASELMATFVPDLAVPASGHAAAAALPVVPSPPLPQCVVHWEAANTASSEALREAAGLTPTASSRKRA